MTPPRGVASPGATPRGDGYEWYHALMLEMPAGTRAAVKRAFELAKREADTTEYKVAFLAMVWEVLGTWEGRTK